MKQLYQSDDLQSLAKEIKECQNLLSAHNSVLFSGEVSLSPMTPSPLLDSILLLLLSPSYMKECLLIDCLSIVIYLTYQSESCQYLLTRNLDTLLCDLCRIPCISSTVFNHSISIFSNLLMDSSQVTSVLLETDTLTTLSSMLHEVQPLEVLSFSQFIVNFTSGASEA